MPGLEFDKPIGADADVSELEYIIALHQTSLQTRANATVSSQDIVALLKSRYGVTISHAQAIRVVRALGGGDTLVEQVAPESTNVVQDMLASVRSKFSKKNSNEDEDGVEDVDADDDIAEEINQQSSQKGQHQPTNSSLKPSASKRALMAKQLKALQGMHSQMQLGQVVPPKKQQSMKNLHQNIAGNLRAQVLRKTHQVSSKLLAMAAQQEQPQEQAKKNNRKNAPSSVSLSNVQEEEGQEIVHVDDNDDDKDTNNEQQPTSGHQWLVTDSVSVREQEGSPGAYKLSSSNDDDDNDPDAILLNDDDDTPAEFLDLVQLLTVLLIPTFARLPLDLQTEQQASEDAPTNPAGQQPESIIHPNNTMETHAAAGEDGPPSDEEPSAVGADNTKNTTAETTTTTTTTTSPSEPRLLGKLINRFVRYGRKKLGITDDSDKCRFAARDFMDIGKRALLKSLLPDEDDEENSDDDDHATPNHLDGADPVVDEALVQLLLLSHGEIERANNPKLVQEMVALAKSESGLLDDEALLNALTSDLGPWDPTCTDVPTTFFYDVFHRAHPSVGTVLRKVDESGRNKLLATGSSRAKSFAGDEESPGAKDTTAGGEKSSKELGCCVKCLKSSFPVIYANRREQNDFNTFLAGLDLDVDLNSSLLIGILMWFTYLAL